MDIGGNKKRLLEAQIAVLGSMLIDPDVAGEAIAETNPNDFTESLYRKVYDACREVYFSRKTIDPVAVCNVLGKEYSQVLTEIMMVTPTSANWKLYAEIMKEQASAERVQNLATELMYSPSMEDAAHIMDKLNEQFCERQGVRIVSFAQGLADFYKRHDGAKPPEYLRWGFGSLNKMLCAESGDFIILGGYPSSGKTVLAMQFAWTMATSCKKQVGIFSLETKDKKLYDRLICQVSGVPFEEIKHNSLSDESWRNISDISEFTDTITLDIINASGMTVNDIRATALSRHYDVIIIDYLQLISSGGRYKGNRTEEVAAISIALHTFAQSSDVTVIALSQLSRQDKTEKNKAPTMASLRESGQLEQDADIVMLLYLINETEPNGERRLKIAKNKEGERGYITLSFAPKRMMFTQVSSRTDEPPRKSRFTELPPENEQEVMDIFNVRGGGT